MLQSRSMNTEELNYTLPEELIAQHPVENRSESRLLIVDRANGTFSEDTFSNIGHYLNPGDAMVVNDTRVIRARLKAHKPTGGKVELFLLREWAPGEWEALVRPSARVKPGSTVFIGDTVKATIEEHLSNGRRRVCFEDKDVLATLQAVGEIPLPPYIARKTTNVLDAERYQTVYADKHGAVAAPTAGLHFTPELLESLADQGIHQTKLTLHVGYGTFKPIQVDSLEEHVVDPEEFYFTDESAQLLNDTRACGQKIISVGTTSTRVLETQYRDGAFQAGEGMTNCYIYPPYEFSGVDTLITNFHLPKSSLLALVCAFGGTQLIQAAYTHAVEQKFRFYSYGDAMLIL